jgi:hypothetical protein
MSDLDKHSWRTLPENVAAYLYDEQGLCVAQVNRTLNGDKFQAWVMGQLGRKEFFKDTATMDEGKQWVMDQLALRRLRGTRV